MHNDPLFPRPTQFLSTKRFDLSHTYGSRAYAISVETPDLTDNAFTAWGDWGPMFALPLAFNQRFTVTYRCLETGRGAQYTFRPPVVALHSPARFVQRQQTPFILKFDDPARGLSIHAYMDKNGAVTVAETKRLSNALDFNALVFAELESPTAVTPLPANADIATQLAS